MVKLRSGPSKRYDGQVAVVTGASSGIGRRVARDLASRGAVVVGMARRGDVLSGVEQELRTFSPESTTTVCDVGDERAYRSALEQVMTRQGPIDILINNAGIGQPPPSRGAGGVDPLEVYRRVFDVNFFGAVTGTTTVLPSMVERRRGIVVNVSSDSARAPEPGVAAYSASKAAVSAFTEATAHEVARHGVRVHVLYPAWVPTAMGLAGTDAGQALPPRAVRRTEKQVSELLLGRMGGERIEINAALLPLLAPFARTVAPVSYQRAMRRWAPGHVEA